jgi:Ca-activated chloride channel family protein
MNQFSFEYPLVLGLILLFVLCSFWCKERSRAIYFPHVEQLLSRSASKSSLLAWLKWVGVVAAVVALSSPVITKTYSNTKKEGRDIVLIIDASDSMRQRGFDPNDIFKNKFDVVKEVVVDFIDQERK